MRRIRAIVSGRVQGVSYRASTADQARALGLTGWVKNLRDGSVALEAEGETEAIDRLLAWCRVGPPAAVVRDVTVEESAPTGREPDFTIAR